MKRRWVLDPERSGIACEATHQRVIARRPPSDRQLAPGSEQVYLQYEDPQITFPLIFTKGIRGRRPLLTLNLAASNELWQQEEGVAATHPPFGAWLRIDDAATAAAISIPDIAHRSEVRSELTIVGGWSNGAWTPMLTRTILAEDELDGSVEDVEPISHRTREAG